MLFPLKYIRILALKRAFWRIFVLLSLNIFCLECVSGQVIYFTDENGRFHTVDLSDGNCVVTTHGVMHNASTGVIFVPSDIAFHPNGSLYATDGLRLFEIDINTLDAHFIGNHNIPYANLFNSLVCDSDGTIYGSGYFLYSINPINGIATELGQLPYQTAGDLAFNEGKLYAACVNNVLLEVNVENPMASTVVGTINSNELFFGIITYATDCTDVETFGTSGGSLYQMDIINANVTFICDLVTNAIYGASTITDYFASECDFFVDLDFDDSSGATSYDYIDTICGNASSPICDLDVDVVAEGAVDSMLIWISMGIQNGANEQLQLSGANNMQVFGSGTSSLKLVSTGGVTAFDLETALINTVYVNTDLNYTPGERQISVKFYSQNENESNLAIAYIELIEPIVFSIDLGPDTSMCEGEILVIDASHPQAQSFEWQDGSTNSVLEVTGSGTYEVTVTDICNNTATASLVAFFSPPSSTIELGPDTTICADESLVLDVTLSEAIDYLWQDGNTSPVINVTQSGLYAVSVTIGCGIITDEISIIFEEIIDVSLFSEDTLICDGEPLVLDVSFPNALSYEWQNGQTSPMVTVSQAGTYSVDIQFKCGALNDEIEVNYIDYVLVADLGPDSTFCFGESVTLNANAPLAESFLWSDNSTVSSFVVNETGSYTVTVSDGCQESRDSVFLEVISCCNIFVPNVFTPNFDGTNDKLKIFSDCEFPNFNLKIFNRWGALVYETYDQEKGWDGLFNGEKANQGSYIWLIEYNDGVEDQIKSGDLTLIR